MTCINDSLFYDVHIHVCMFHTLYCDVVNSGEGGVECVGLLSINFYLMEGGGHIFFSMQEGCKTFFA